MNTGGPNAEYEHTRDGMTIVPLAALNATFNDPDSEILDYMTKIFWLAYDAGRNGLSADLAALINPD